MRWIRSFQIMFMSLIFYYNFFFTITYNIYFFYVDQFPHKFDANIRRSFFFYKCTGNPFQNVRRFRINKNRTPSHTESLTLCVIWIAMMIIIKINRTVVCTQEIESLSKHSCKNDDGWLLGTAWAKTTLNNIHDTINTFIFRYDLIILLPTNIHVKI